MIQRTTIEIDQALLARAKRALGCETMKATVEEALRRAADDADTELADRGERQMAYFHALGERADLTILSSDEMWR